MSNVFEKLSKVDVSEYKETKGKYAYLSWADAVNELLKVAPDATWEVVKDVNGYPYTDTPCGFFVEVRMTIGDIKRSQVHPVLDNYNKSIVKPNSFQINTSIQRCLAKVIALHGLGLYIYRGEDLPEQSEQIAPDPVNSAHVDYAVTEYIKMLNADVEEVDYKRMQALDRRLTNDERIAVNESLGNEKHSGGRFYRTLLADYLKMKDADLDNPDKYDAGAIDDIH